MRIWRHLLLDCFIIRRRGCCRLVKAMSDGRWRGKNAPYFGPVPYGYHRTLLLTGQDWVTIEICNLEYPK